MDPIFESYKMANEATTVSRDELPSSEKEWIAEVKKFVGMLKKKYPMINFDGSEVNWDDIKGQIHCRFVIRMEMDVSKAPYIDSVPYVNFTKAFFNDLDKMAGHELGVDKISFNNTGSTFWGYLHSD